MAPDVSNQPLTTSPSHRPAAVTTTTAEDPVLDQFQQMRSIISSFWVHIRTLLQVQDSRSATISTMRWNTWKSNFFTFRNETVKRLSGIQYKAEECKRQVTTTQQVITFQLSEATQATAGREYILTILDTQLVSALVVQPTPTAAPQPATVIAKVQQPQRPASVTVQPASYLAVDHQQPGTSRQLMFTLSPAKTFNSPSVASGQQEDS